MQVKLLIFFKENNRVFFLHGWGSSIPGSLLQCPEVWYLWCPANWFVVLSSRGVWGWQSWAYLLKNTEPSLCTFSLLPHPSTLTPPINHALKMHLCLRPLQSSIASTLEIPARLDWNHLHFPLPSTSFSFSFPSPLFIRPSVCSAKCFLTCLSLLTIGYRLSLPLCSWE